MPTQPGGSVAEGLGGLRFAYADPPYPGKSRKYYRGHADYAGEVDHQVLIERLEAEFPDGWALSTSAAALWQILPLCPAPGSRGAAGGGTRESIRVLAWCKPLSQPGMGGPLYGWEPVILRGGRRERHGPRDWLVCSPELFTMRRRPPDHVTGAKPPAFLRWVFECLGARRGDELVDLFPGRAPRRARGMTSRRRGGSSMSLRDQTNILPLTARELDVLNALRQDRDEAGPGIHRWTVEEIDGTAYPDVTIARLRDHGYVIGAKDGQYQLGHDEPGVERATETAAFPRGAKDDQACAPRSVDGSLSDEQLPLEQHVTIPLKTEPGKAPHYRDAA